MNKTAYFFLLSLIAGIFLSGAAQALPIGSPGVSQKPVADQSPAERQATQGFEALAKGDLKTAEATFSEALKLDPKQVGSMLGLAEVSLQRKRPKEAEARLKEALTTQPENGEVHAAYGRYHFSQGRYTEAEASYKKAINLNKQVFLAYMDLGDLYLTVQRRPKEAVEAYGKAVALHSIRQPHSVRPCQSSRLTRARSLGTCRSPKPQWSMASTAQPRAVNTSPYGGDCNAGRPASTSSLPHW